LKPDCNKESRREKKSGRLICFAEIFFAFSIPFNDDVRDESQDIHGTLIIFVRLTILYFAAQYQVIPP
jgi:hypothetical protein